MLNGHEILFVNPDIATQDTGDEFVVVLPEQGKYVVVNATGAKIVKLADGKRTLNDIAIEISSSFDINLEQVIQDVLTFSADLISRGVLSLVETEIN